MDDCLPEEWRETPPCKASLQHSAMQLKLLISMYKNEELDNMKSLNLANLMKFPIPPHISKNWVDPSPKRPASSKPKTSIKTRSIIPRKSSVGSFIKSSTTISSKIPSTVATKSQPISSPANLWAMTSIKIGPGLKNSSVPIQADGTALSKLKISRTTPTSIVNYSNTPKKRRINLAMAGGLVPTKTSKSSQGGLQMAHDDVVWGLNQTKQSVITSDRSPISKSTSPVRSPTKISPESSTRRALRSSASLAKSSPTSLERSLGRSIERTIERSIERSIGKSLERSLETILTKSLLISPERSLSLNPAKIPAKTSVKSSAGSQLLSKLRNIALNPTRSSARTSVKSPTRSLARSAVKNPTESQGAALSISPITSFVIPPKRKVTNR
ncbi:unnamed protein product [Psylliodes chrysocephalus]|uniref:Uncharacterized protein n=1 Tax=Psylliodes chrysocephalus TaxID=3402493 RepID=A0A9P0CZX4_9CUCU|nr:unnamed protein product [Psylliodes chrysocephala]